MNKIFQPLALGDLVKLILTPWVLYSDRFRYTNLAGCEKCEIRRQNLNRSVPDVYPAFLLLIIIWSTIF